MADEPRRSVRATKGQHTKSLDVLDQTAEPSKKRGGKKASSKKATSQEPSGAEEEEVIRCVCGVTEQDEDDEGIDWIACEECNTWQHNICMGVTTDPKLLKSLRYFCEQCKPENHKELLAAMEKGEKPWEERRRLHDEALKGKQSGKKGKGKRASDPKLEPEQNGKGKAPETPAEVKKEKKETASRTGSVKRKLQKEDSLEEPAKQNKIRKTSAPLAKSPTPQTPSDLPSSIAELDKQRSPVAKLILKSLHFAMKNAQKSGKFEGSESELDQKATRLALEIESATFNTHQGATYGVQARKLAANLKSNQELCDRLLNKSLRPTALAIMSDEELASKEFQRQTAEMKARADKQSIMIQEDGPRIRRTHKGEEVIEQSNDVPSDDSPARRRRNMSDPNAGMGDRSRENSIGDGNELPMELDEYRSQDDIRGNATFGSSLSIDTRQPQPPRKGSTQTGDFDFNKVMSSVQSPTAPQHIRKPSGQLPQRQGPGVDPEIDRLLEDGNESPPYSPAEYDEDPSIVWRGEMNMNSVATFPAVARHIGGADLSNIHGSTQIPWSDLIPSKLQVAGRIDQDKASEYLCSLRYSAPTDIVVVALTPTGEKATQEFEKLFEYFHSKNRYGVVGNKGAANVRDTYLVPVSAGTGNIPEFMMNLENNKLPTDRPERVLLVTLVIRSQPSELPPQIDGNRSPSVVGHPQRQMSIGGNGPAMSPIAPQGAFGTPLTPQPLHQPPNPQAMDADVKRRQHLELQQNGERLARGILGELINAPTVSFLIPQAYQMQAHEWNVIRDIFMQDPKSQNDLQHLSDLLKARNDGPDGAK